MAYGYRKPEDLPQTIAVFPLAGALLLPRANLPLNIFEPRYLNMVDDALASDRLIGMIQPASGGEQSAAPALREIGCLGRLTSFAETGDGRYLITLTGLCRFHVAREFNAATPYRQVEAGYFAGDLIEHAGDYAIDRDRLGDSLRAFADARGLSVDMASMESAPSEALINTLAALCPFDVEEKQALLEAPSIPERAETLIALLDIHAAGGDTPSAMQ
jgi:Lon protease-like protein